MTFAFAVKMFYNVAMKLHLKLVICKFYDESGIIRFKTNGPVIATEAFPFSKLCT